MLALAGTRRSCISARHVSKQLQVIRSNTLARRNLHPTSVVSKTKKKQATQAAFDDGDDAFFAAEGDELFASPTAKASSRPTTTTTADVVGGTRQKPKGKLTVEERANGFEELYQFLSDRIGLHPPAKARRDPRQVRKTAWQHLFGLATTEEHLERVTELFPKWRDARQQFTPNIAEAFVGRCEELRCPTLALKVFSDHSKYGFDLNHLPAARHLLHSLHVEHPLEKSIVLSALYGVYKLPAISSDLVSCAMVTAACFKAKTEESLVIAQALVPELKDLLEKTRPETMVYPEDNYTRSLKGNREKAWLRWTLLKIEKALEAQKQPVAWLASWRAAAASGPTVPAPSPA